MLDNVGLRYPHRASGAKAPRTLRPLPLLRFAVSATGGAHLCSIQYYLRFWLSICRTSLAVSALRIMRYCHRNNSNINNPCSNTKAKPLTNHHTGIIESPPQKRGNRRKEVEQYNVTGMSCAACSARVEKAVSKVPGVTSCSVSLLTNSMGVEGTAAPADIVAAVEAAGYGASPKNAAAQSAAPSADSLKRYRDPAPQTPPDCLADLLGGADVLLHGAHDVELAAAGLLCRATMWPWVLLQMLLTIIIMVINQKFFISGFKSAVAPCAQYGYPGSPWRYRGLRLQHLRSVCHDGAPRCRGMPWPSWAICRSFILNPPP